MPNPTKFPLLTKANRLLLEANLTPVQGDRFQPTGFADLGAATYKHPDGTRMLLVESAQSIANRLEATVIGPDGKLIPELEGLSYVSVKLTGASSAETNSLIEAHRLNSPFIINEKAGFKDSFVKMAEYAPDQPLNWTKIAKALFHFDANSVIHGTFLSNLQGGRVKIARALSGFIEARNVREVVSGGVKNSHLDPSGSLHVIGDSKNVYSNVPFQRTEFTAEKITAYFNLDLNLLRSYDLGVQAEDLLTALSLFKIRKFLEYGTRLRTACDLAPIGDGFDYVNVTRPEDFIVPTTDTLLSYIQEDIKACSTDLAGLTELKVPTQKTKKKAQEEKIESTESE